VASLDQLDRQYVATIKRLRSRLEDFAKRQFTAGQWRDADADRFVAVVAPMVLAGERTVASLTDAWLSQRLTRQLGRTVDAGVPADEVTGRATRDVDPDQMWRRPYVKVRSDLSEGKTLPDAVAAGSLLATQLVATSMQLAKTHTAQRVFTQTKGVTWYRRVVTGSHSCALCYVASTQRYHKRDLLPIHPGCDCLVMPMTTPFDPGRVIDPDTLAGTHEAMAERFGVSDPSARAIDYRKAILVREHGEIGPTLTVAEHRFTGPSAVG
jgi:hypothetical protein